MSTFAKNRDRLLEMDAAAELLAGVVSHPDVRRQMSRDHFSVDGTLIDALRGLLAAFLAESPADDRWASMKSFKPKNDPGDDDGPGRNAERDFCGEKRSNETHASTTDPDARLDKKAERQPSRLCFVGTALMENRNGLVVDGRLIRASGVSERLSAVARAEAHIRQGGTLAGDKGFDTADVVAECRERRITSRRTPATLAQVDQGGEAATQHRRADDPTRRLCREPKAPQAPRGDLRPPWSPDHGPFKKGSLRCCARWLKTVAAWRKSRFRDLDRTGHGFHLALAAYNLAQMPTLLVAEGA